MAESSPQEENKQRNDLRRGKQQPELLYTAGRKQKSAGKQHHGSSHGFNQKYRLQPLTRLVIVTCQDTDSSKKGSCTVYSQSFRRHGGKRCFRHAKQPAERIRKHHYCCNQKCAHRDARGKSQSHRISAPAYIVFPVIGRKYWLHGPGGSLIEIENRIRGILYQIEYSHTVFPGKPHQNVVAEPEKHHLIQILHRGGKAGTQTLHHILHRKPF